MVRFWDIRGYLQEEVEWLERALAHVPDEPTKERATALTALGVNAWFTGDVDRALARQEQALAIWRALDDPKAIVRSLWFIGLVAAKRGDVARLESLWAEASPLTAHFGLTLWQTVPVSLLALAALLRGDGVRAAELMHPAADFQQQHGYVWPHAWMLGVLAEAAMLEGDRPRALGFHQQSLREFCDAGDVYATLDGLTAVASHAVAFGEAEIGTRLLGAAATTRAKVGYRLTWTSVTEGQVIAAARSALTAEAYAAAHAAGTTMSLDAAVTLALNVAPGVSTAAAVPMSHAADPFGLSPREREVLQLIAEGMSNQEIGDALFISHRTAGTHVTNILGKLGVDSRAAAVALAHTRGVI